MAGAVVGALRVDLGLNSAAFGKGLADAQKKLATTSQRMQAIGSSMAGLGAKMSVGITAPLAALAVSSSKAATESAQAMGQVNAALASMGSAAGRSSEQLAKSAEGLMKISTFDDDEILQKSTAQLLTFGNVAGEQFDRAQLAAVNLATRMGGDLQGAAIMIGKALNDPVAGLSKLSKAGIQFTDQQKAQIAAMAAAGNAAGAQSIMLAELEKQFGGSAEAQRKATPGIESKQAWDNFQEIIGKVVNEALPPLTAMLTRVLDSFNNMSPGMQQIVIGGAAMAAAFGPVIGGLGGMVMGASKMGPLFTGISKTFKYLDGAMVKLLPTILNVGKSLLVLSMNPIALTLGAIALAVGAVYLAWKNWDKITAIAKAVYTSVKVWVLDKLNAVWDGVKKGVDRVTGFFRGLWDAVVGHSYIPDMVDSIGAHMARLDGLMVKPSEKATQGTADAFRELQGIIDGLYPDEAEWKGFEAHLARIAELGKRAKLSTDQIGALQNRAREKRDDDRFGKNELPKIDPGEITFDAPVIEASAFEIPTVAASGLLATLERIQTGLQGIGDISRTAFSDVADSILSSAIPAIEAMRSATATLGEKIGAVGNALSTIFGAIFGKKAGRIIGAIGQVGSSFATAFAGNGKVPAFANGGSFKVGGRPGIDKNLVQFRATRGEMVDIRKPGNDNGGSIQQHFTINAQGSIMASDIMHEIKATGIRAALGGSADAQVQTARRGRRRLA